MAPLLPPPMTIYMYMNTYKHTHTHVRAHTYISVYTYTQAYIDRYIETLKPSCNTHGRDTHIEFEITSHGNQTLYNIISSIT